MKTEQKPARESEQTGKRESKTFQHRAILRNDNRSEENVRAGLRPAATILKGALLILVWLAFMATAKAATVTNRVLNAQGVGVRTNVVFTPKSTPLFPNSGQILSSPQTITSDTNGNYSINLNYGRFSVASSGLSQDIVIINVPDSTNTFNLRDLLPTNAPFLYPTSPSYEMLVHKGQPNGYAPLDVAGLISLAYLPPFTGNYVSNFNGSLTNSLTLLGGNLEGGIVRPARLNLRIGTNSTDSWSVIGDDEQFSLNLFGTSSTFQFFTATRAGNDVSDISFLSTSSFTVNSPSIKFPTGANNGYVWTSDANGGGSWQALPGGGNQTPILQTVNYDGNGATNLSSLSITFVDGDGYTNYLAFELGLDGDMHLTPSYNNAGTIVVGSSILSGRQNNYNGVFSGLTVNGSLSSGIVISGDAVTAPTGFLFDGDVGIRPDGGGGLNVTGAGGSAYWNFEYTGKLLPTGISSLTNDIGSSNNMVSTVWATNYNGVKKYWATISHHDDFLGTIAPYENYVFENTVGNITYSRSAYLGQYYIDVLGGFDTNKTTVFFGNTFEPVNGDAISMHYQFTGDNRIFFWSYDLVNGGPADNLMYQVPIQILVAP